LRRLLLTAEVEGKVDVASNRKDLGAGVPYEKKIVWSLFVWIFRAFFYQCL
jgi:hypothetical protein